MILEQRVGTGTGTGTALRTGTAHAASGRETNKYVRHVTDFVGMINDLANMSASHVGPLVDYVSWEV